MRIFLATKSEFGSRCCDVRGESASKRERGGSESQGVEEVEREEYGLTRREV